MVPHVYSGLGTLELKPGHVGSEARQVGKEGWSLGECRLGYVEREGAWARGECKLITLVLQDSHAGNKSWSRRK